MILTDEEMEARLGSPSNLINSLLNEVENEVENEKENILEVREIPSGGRGKGNSEIPTPVRALLGILHRDSNSTGTEIARTFGVSNPVVTDAARGLVGRRQDEELINTMSKVDVKKENNKSEQAHNAALDVMVSSLGILGVKLDSEGSLLKPKELSRIASDMSKIVSVGKDKDRAGDTINNTQVIVYQPKIRKEDSYETIEA